MITAPSEPAPMWLQDFQEEVGYTMAANEYYWDGEVPFESVELLYMGDASAKAMALQSGQLDLAENVTNISDLNTLRENPEFTVTIASSVRTGLAHMNMSEGRLLSNKTLREASADGSGRRDNVFCYSRRIVYFRLFGPAFQSGLWV